MEIASFDAITKSAPPSASAETSASRPPHTFRNIAETSASQPNLVILFVDYLNTRLADRMGLREGLLKYLATTLKRDQEIAVYGLTERPVMLQPFTRDPSSLIAVARDLLKQKGQSRDLLFAKIPAGLNPFAIRVIPKPGNKHPT